ncbi:MAG: dTDP-4-dehydrorhamnose reductase [Deltaproteobacteria bacterium]|nr:dTDP-4-dehydrorhamnose reductase [Deltaproteobacteria bacterium]MBW2142851.1 dTDP-4-dehydrorhamnose reductase [Deltaproteobacteria bacterium]
MKILIIGANGQLGWELSRRAAAMGFDTVPLDLPGFDITDRSQVQKGVGQAGVSLVINAAAHTAVDQAESEEELAFAINRDGPSYLASSCAEAGIPLIHISTDYVFDGTKKSLYSENDPVCPLGVYGKSKADGEIRIREHLREHIILRTAWLYGVHGHNFVKTMLRLGREQDRVRVVSDQYGCPTYAGDLADATLDIAGRIRDGKNIAWGTYHYCCKGETSWLGFAEKIFKLASQYVPVKVEKVEGITTEDYPTPAKRPARSGLDCSFIETQFGINPRPWQESLEEMIAHIFDTENENNAL